MWSSEHSWTWGNTAPRISTQTVMCTICRLLWCITVAALAPATTLRSVGTMKLVRNIASYIAVCKCDCYYYCDINLRLSKMYYVKGEEKFSESLVCRKACSAAASNIFLIQFVNAWGTLFFWCLKYSWHQFYFTSFYGQRFRMIFLWKFGKQFLFLAAFNDCHFSVAQMSDRY